MKNFSRAQANEIYDVLVIAGADEHMRDSFIYHHCDSKDGCDEWRFQGKLGYGGKYWSRTNTVNCYLEDENPGRKPIISYVNSELKRIATLYENNNA